MQNAPADLNCIQSGPLSYNLVPLNIIVNLLLFLTLYNVFVIYFFAVIFHVLQD